MKPHVQMIPGELPSFWDRNVVFFSNIHFNFNTDTEGHVTKGQFLCIGDDSSDCLGLLTHAWSELPVEWRYDRD